MLNYMIVVEDAGELKSVSAAELETQEPAFRDLLETHLNTILDNRAIAAGEYDPSENDIPIEVRR